MVDVEHADGFDRIVTADLPLEYVVTGTPTVVTTNPHTGPQHLHTTNWNQELSRNTGIAANATKGQSVAVRTALPSSTVRILGFYNVAVLHIAVGVDSTGRIVIQRATTTIATDDVQTIFANQWHHVRAKVLIADAGGTVDVWVDNNLVLSFSGDTRNAGAAQVDACSLSPGNSSSATGAPDYDDWVVLTDDAGGDVRCYEVEPNANGDTNQGAGSDGNSTDNYLLVDDADADQDSTDYIDLNTASDKDLYGTANIGITGTVLAVAVHTAWKRTDAGAATARNKVRLSGSESNGVTVSPPTVVGMQEDVFNTKPGGGAWSVSDTDSMQIGTERVA